jgi:hypothetical protein
MALAPLVVMAGQVSLPLLQELPLLALAAVVVAHTTAALPEQAVQAAVQAARATTQHPLRLP